MAIDEQGSGLDNPPQSDPAQQSTATSTAASAAAGTAAGSALPGSWERGVLEKLLLEQLKEQRSRRRWGIFFKSASLMVVIIILLMFSAAGEGETHATGPHTALVEVEGVIEAGANAGAQNVNAALGRAFAEESSVGVIVRINSPGGSPVQAGMINDEIARLRAKYPKKPVHVVVDEMCASGGYYIAAAADKIYVNKASIIGSIGVLMDGFGFTGLMDKLGVERRLMTAGENKAIFDPFSPISGKHKAYGQQMLDEIHQQFIEVVRKGRGKRLKETPETFSGLFWSGAKAIDMGLADGLGTVDSVARDVLKAEEVVDYTERENWSDRVLKKFGTALGSGAMRQISGSSLHLH
jgi:protease-4